MSTAEPSLTSNGWITDPIGTVKMVIANYMLADVNQSSLLPAVRCFMLQHGKHASEPETLCNLIKDDLQTLIKSKLSDIQIQVSYKQRVSDGALKSVYDISIVALSDFFSSNMTSSALSFKAELKNGNIDNFIFNYMEETS